MSRNLVLVHGGNEFFIAILQVPKYSHRNSLQEDLHMIGNEYSNYEMEFPVDYRTFSHFLICSVKVLRKTLLIYIRT